MKYYLVGKIMTTHGIKGEVKVQNYSDFDRYKKDQILYVLHNGKYEKLEVLFSREYPKGMYVTFKGLEDINLVLKYHSDELFIAEDDREKLEDEFYVSDLIGLKVYNQDMEERGEIVDVLDLPQGSVLVSLYNGARKTIPFRDEFIIEISDKIIVKEIEGLF